MKRTHRYLIALLPGPEVTAHVLRLRALLRERIGTFGGLHVPPHLTLCLADLDEAQEGIVLDAVGRGAAQGAAFPIAYSGIAHFPDRRTIYIDPVQKPEVAAVRGPVAAELSAALGPGERLLVTDHPHLTIAAGLKPQQFEEAWRLLSPHACQAYDQVDAVAVLRRELKPGSRYGLLRTYAISAGR